MERRRMNRCGGPAGSTAPSLPFGDPLDLLAEDHRTLRQICSDLDRLATSGPLDPERIGALLGFLGEGLADHLADEDEDLFPMLRQKCDSEDEILPTLDRLCADHAQVRSSLKGVMAGLHRTMEAHQGLSPQETETCKTFAALKLRHVILENAIVLPIARVRLSRRDLQDLSDRMLRRRRLDRLAGGVNAG